MFAPRIAKSHAKSAEKLVSSQPQHRSTLVSQTPSRYAVEQTQILQGSTGWTTNREVEPGCSWEFSKIPVSARDRTDQPGAQSRVAAPQLVGALQPKLAVERDDDPLEFEADRIASQVMRMTAPNVSTPIVSPQFSRECVASGEKEAQTLGDGPDGRTSVASGSEALGLVHEAIRSPGEPLDPRTRAFFEPRFGHDFSQVRVHADNQGAESAQAVSALAYTAGSHIAFAPNQYTPQTPTGQHLLAHELAHVVQQQRSGRVTSTSPAVVQRWKFLKPEPMPRHVIPNTVPGLGLTRTQLVQDAIDHDDRQDAIDKLVRFTGINTSLLANGKIAYDPDLKSDDGTTAMPSWDYINNKADPAKVKIGPGAFSSVSYLYSVIWHEYQHVQFQQSLSNQKLMHDAQGHGGMDTDEVEASAWELLHATETGLASQPDKIAEVWKQLNDEFWQLDPAAQAAKRPLALRALGEAQRFVRGSQVNLHPFSR